MNEEIVRGETLEEMLANVRLESSGQSARKVSLSTEPASGLSQFAVVATGILVVAATLGNAWWQAGKTENVSEAVPSEGVDNVSLTHE